MAVFKITKQYRDVIKCADFADINSRDVCGALIVASTCMSTCKHVITLYKYTLYMCGNSHSALDKCFGDYSVHAMIYRPAINAVIA